MELNSILTADTSGTRTEAMADEIWKRWPGSQNYLVSNYGNVKSVARTVNHFAGGKRNKKEKDLKPFYRDGYRHVGLYYTDEKSGEIKVLDHYKIAWMVLEAFVGPRPKDYVARHLNDIKDDDRLLNLSWGTLQENAADCIRNGKMPRGLKHGKASLSAEALEEIRNAKANYKGWYGRKALAEKFGVHVMTISHARTGYTYGD